MNINSCPWVITCARFLEVPGNVYPGLMHISKSESMVSPHLGAPLKLYAGQNLSVVMNCCSRSTSSSNPMWYLQKKKINQKPCLVFCCLVPCVCFNPGGTKPYMEIYQFCWPLFQNPRPGLHSSSTPCRLQNRQNLVCVLVLSLTHTHLDQAELLLLWPLMWQK